MCGQNSILFIFFLQEINSFFLFSELILTSKFHIIHKFRHKFSFSYCLYLEKGYVYLKINIYIYIYFFLSFKSKSKLTLSIDQTKNEVHFVTCFKAKEKLRTHKKKSNSLIFFLLTFVHFLQNNIFLVRRQEDYLIQ